MRGVDQGQLPRNNSCIFVPAWPAGPVVEVFDGTRLLFSEGLPKKRA